MIHVTSPTQNGATGTTEDEIVKPAVDNLNALLAACQKEKVKRLVLTSSIHAVLGMFDHVNQKIKN